MCGDNNSTGQVTFLAGIISFDGVNRTDLLSQLQQWVQTRPSITVSGVLMTVSGDCSVYLGELSRPMCIPITIPPSPEPTTPEANNNNQAEVSSTNLPVIPIAAGLGGGMLLLLVIILLLVIALICKRRKRNHQRNRYDTLIQSPECSVLPLLISYSNHYTTTMHEASGTDNQSNKFAESKLSTSEEHLYEPLPEHTPAQSDRHMQQTTIVTNPSACESSTAHFNFSGDLVDPYEPFPHHP